MDTQIPPDVMKAAREAWLQASTTLSAKRGDPASVIARAIMAERERCAAILAARLPLYAENLAQTNAVRECRESILTP